MIRAAHPHEIRLLPKIENAADRRFARVGMALNDKTAYQRIQATRPQTHGVALSDSPVGLVVWIVEKFRNWLYCGIAEASRPPSGGKIDVQTTFAAFAADLAPAPPTQ